MRPQGTIIAAHTGESGADFIEFLQLYVQRQQDDPEFKFRLDMMDREDVLGEGTPCDLTEDEIEGKGSEDFVFIIVED